MSTVALLGPAFAGKANAIQHIARSAGGTPMARPPYLELATRGPEVGAVTVLTLPGRGAPESAYLEIIRRADAIVFVVDLRRSRAEATIEAWDGHKRRLEATGRPADLPTVILYGSRDDPDAGPIEEIDEALGIQSMMFAGDLRLPNPVALRYPARFEEILPAFEAACRAAVHGPFAVSADAKDFAMAMLDKQLAQQLASIAPALPNAESIAKRAVRGDAGAAERLRDGARDQFAASREAIREAVAERILEDALIEQRAYESGVQLTEDGLACPKCKTPVEYFPLAGLPETFADGDTISVTSLARGGDWLVRPPDPGSVVTQWLAWQVCAGCGGSVWGLVAIVHGSLDSITVVAELDRALLARVNVISAFGARMAAMRLSGQDELIFAPRSQVFEALARVLA